MAFKMKGFSGFKSSPLKQEGPVDEKNPKLQKGEMEGTFVYKGGRKSERKIDLEDRIEFLTSDIEGGSDRPNQNIADMKKTRSKLKAELAILERQGKTPPFKKKNWSKKKVKKKEDKVKKLTGKYKELREKRKEGGQDPSKKQKRAGRKAVGVSNRKDKLERKIYEKSGRKAAEEKRFIEIQKSLNKIEKASKDPEYIKRMKNRKSINPLFNK